MTLAWSGCVVKWMSAGKGFIALSRAVFAELKLLLALATSLIFGLTEGFDFAVAVTPRVKDVIPFYFVNMRLHTFLLS